MRRFLAWFVVEHPGTVANDYRFPNGTAKLKELKPVN